MKEIFHDDERNNKKNKTKHQLVKTKRPEKDEDNPQAPNGQRFAPGGAGGRKSSARGAGGGRFATGGWVQYNSATFSFNTILVFWFSTFLDILLPGHSARS